MSLRPTARTEVRRNRYKVSVDAEEGRRRREDNMVEIRKSKREESLQKKRREGLQAQQFPSAVHTSTVEKKVLSHSIVSISLPHSVDCVFGNSLGSMCDSGGFGIRSFESYERLIRGYRCGCLGFYD